MDITYQNNKTKNVTARPIAMSQGMSQGRPEPATSESFGKRLKLTRESRGISQKKLGEIVGTSAISIQSWEQSTMPKVDMLAKLAEALECSLDWLVYGVQDKVCPKGSAPVDQDGEDSVKTMLQVINSRLQAIETRLRMKDLEAENARLRAMLEAGDYNAGERSAGGM